MEKHLNKLIENKKLFLHSDRESNWVKIGEKIQKYLDENYEYGTEYTCDWSFYSVSIKLLK
ncbi:MAG: hypothetical protein WD512_02905 [Candidatus Paceibacterota bacterium]